MSSATSENTRVLVSRTSHKSDSFAWSEDPTYTNLRLVTARKVGIFGQIFEMECPISSPLIESPKPMYHFEAYRLLCSQKAIICHIRRHIRHRVLQKLVCGGELFVFV